MKKNRVKSFQKIVGILNIFGVAIIGWSVTEGCKLEQLSWLSAT